MQDTLSAIIDSTEVKVDLRASGAHKLIKVEPSVSANVVLVNDILFHIFEKIVFDVLM